MSGKGPGTSSLSRHIKKAVQSVPCVAASQYVLAKLFTSMEIRVNSWFWCVAEKV